MLYFLNFLLRSIIIITYIGSYFKHFLHIQQKFEKVFPVFIITELIHFLPITTELFSILMKIYHLQQNFHYALSTYIIKKIVIVNLYIKFFRFHTIKFNIFSFYNLHFTATFYISVIQIILSPYRKDYFSKIRTKIPEM